MAMKDVEGALRGVFLGTIATECSMLADALGVERECGASEEACEACASRMAEAIVSQMMPEGMSWPRFADGEPVRIGDAVESEFGTAFEVECVEVYGDHAKLYAPFSGFFRVEHGERVKRPEPEDTQELIDADARKSACEYFGWEGVPCSEKGGCPARERFLHCGDAKTFDLLRRQRELCAKEAAR